MYVIHKFKVPKIGEPFTLENVDKVVRFGVQGSEYFVWGVVYKNSLPGKSRRYVVIGTGQEYGYNWEHQYTIITQSGLVWHLLKERKVSEHLYPLY